VVCLKYLAFLPWLIHSLENKQGQWPVASLRRAWPDKLVITLKQEPIQAVSYSAKGLIQAGLDPDDWKPFDVVGAGTKEIRLLESGGSYRVMYVAKFEEAIYVLHCFQKKAQTTTKQDKNITEARYRAVVNARKSTT